MMTDTLKVARTSFRAALVKARAKSNGPFTPTATPPEGGSYDKGACLKAKMEWGKTLSLWSRSTPTAGAVCISSKIPNVAQFAKWLQRAWPFGGPTPSKFHVCEDPFDCQEATILRVVTHADLEEDSPHTTRFYLQDAIFIFT